MAKNPMLEFAKFGGLFGFLLALAMSIVAAYGGTIGVNWLGMPASFQANINSMGALAFYFYNTILFALLAGIPVALIYSQWFKTDSACSTPFKQTALYVIPLLFVGGVLLKAIVLAIDAQILKDVAFALNASIPNAILPYFALSLIFGFIVTLIYGKFNILMPVQTVTKY